MRLKRNVNSKIMAKMKKDFFSAAGIGVMISVLLAVFTRDFAKAGVVLMLSFVGAALLSVNEIEKHKSEKKKKEEALREAYPSLIYALTGFIEGGMSVREGFKTIIRLNLVTQPILREKIETLNLKLDNGMSMQRALNEFSRSIGIKEYKKLSGLISQNERAGSIDLVKVMELELVETEHMKIRYAKERAEKKKVVMLLPITMLLFVVILILMGPAFIQLQTV